MSMHMASTLIVMMVLLIGVIGGLMLVLRTLGAREVRDDHPR
jgi:uncharacterized protein YneF (UPF0154 family)